MIILPESRGNGHHADSVMSSGREETRPGVRWRFSTRPRHLGAMIGGSVIGIVLWREGFSMSAIALILTCAALSLIVYKLSVDSSRIRERHGQRWDCVVLAGIVSAAIGGAISPGREGVLLVLTAYSLSLHIFYCLVKLGCHQFGCCDVKDRSFSPALPMIEAVVSGLVFLFMASIYWLGIDVSVVAACSLAIHSSLRLASRTLRGTNPVHSVLALDTGGLLCIGLVVAFVY